MDSNEFLLNKLIDETILYHSEIGLAICRLCQVACSKDFERHLQRDHKTLTLLERQAILNYLKSLPEKRSIEEVNQDYSPAFEVDAIEGLQIVSGFKCNKCTFVGIKSTVIDHCRKQHGWTTSQCNCIITFN
jgi:hypothetical protein